MFELIFLSLFVAGWLACGALPWLALSVWTRGHAGLLGLPLTLFTAVVAGLAVPTLGLDSSVGLVLSFIVALVAASLILAARQLGRSANATMSAPVRTEADEPLRR